MLTLLTKTLTSAVLLGTVLIGSYGIGRTLRSWLDPVEQEGRSSVAASEQELERPDWIAELLDVLPEPEALAMDAAEAVRNGTQFDVSDQGAMRLADILPAPGETPTTPTLSGSGGRTLLNFSDRVPLPFPDGTGLSWSGPVAGAIAETCDVLLGHTPPGCEVRLFLLPVQLDDAPFVVVMYTFEKQGPGAPFFIEEMGVRQTMRNAAGDVSRSGSGMRLLDMRALDEPTQVLSVGFGSQGQAFSIWNSRVGTPNAGERP